MEILLHICCAPCCLLPYEHLSDEGHQVTGYFYNPNVHPFIEFRRRMKSLKVLQERLPIEVIYEEDYGLGDYLKQVDWSAGRAERCPGCYRMRLGRAARQAAEGGFPAFSTTLLESTHQDHGLIRSIAEECARDSGVEFRYADWRPLAEEGHRRARQLRLYLQSYCGCVFSEWERFRRTRRHVYHGPGGAPEAGA
ncbi:MAG: epoxyqueuosine reductase QueH [Planctomycetota bacterium]|jgi:predicted adenine nucleotide alpha hydrolase (AANH) superfamily ATPase